MEEFNIRQNFFDSEHNSNFNKFQQYATVCGYLFTAQLLYMSRVSITPIVRST